MAYRIAEWQRSARKAFHAFEVAALACWKSKSFYFSNTLGGAYGVVDRRRAQCLRELHEANRVARRFVAVRRCESHHPAAALEREDTAAAAIASRVSHHRQHFPIGRCGVRNGKCGRRIGHIDPDLSLLRQRQAASLQERQRGYPAARGIDDEVRGQSLATFCFVLEAHSLRNALAGRRDKLQHPARSPDGHIGYFRNASPDDRFEKRSRQCIAVKAKVALWVGVKTGLFDPDVAGHLVSDCAGGREVIPESRKQLLQCSKSTDQQQMRVSALRHAGAGCRAHRQRVALQDDDLREKLGESRRSR